MNKNRMHKKWSMINKNNHKTSKSKFNNKLSIIVLDQEDQEINNQGYFLKINHKNQMSKNNRNPQAKMSKLIKKIIL